MKLSVHLVSWNGTKYIPHLFKSLRHQTFKDWSLYIIDNGSEDNTVAAVKKELENFSVPYKLVENKENIGFAPAHNLCFQATASEYFLLLNQDMYLAPECLEKMVNFLDEHKDAAAVAPRLMKWDFASVRHKQESVGDENGFGATNIIDALGLKVFRDRRVIEQFTGQDWNSISVYLKGKVLEVFGVSGAFPMFRRSMIKDVSFAGDQFLDESYHSYKEDVDLAYRLAARGFKSYVLLDVVAYHDRSGAGPRKMDDRSAVANKKKQSDWVKYHSYKNHLRTLYKNEYRSNLLLDLPWILWYEIKKLGYCLLFDRQVLAGLKEIWYTRADLADKRKQVIKMRPANGEVLRKWWS